MSNRYQRRQEAHRVRKDSERIQKVMAANPDLLAKAKTKEGPLANAMTEAIKTVYAGEPVLLNDVVAVCTAIMAGYIVAHPDPAIRAMYVRLIRNDFANQVAASREAFERRNVVGLMQSSEAH